MERGAEESTMLGTVLSPGGVVVGARRDLFRRATTADLSSPLPGGVIMRSAMWREIQI